MRLGGFAPDEVAEIREITSHLCRFSAMVATSSRTVITSTAASHVLVIPGSCCCSNLTAKWDDGSGHQFDRVGTGPVDAGRHSIHGADPTDPVCLSPLLSNARSRRRDNGLRLSTRAGAPCRDVVTTPVLKCDSRRVPGPGFPVR